MVAEGGKVERFIQTATPVTNAAVLDDMTGDGKTEIAISSDDR
jgi:hypothetical protein